ncbi:MAG: hypothetical protein V3U53_01850 [bacterium]
MRKNQRQCNEASRYAENPNGYAETPNGYAVAFGRSFDQPGHVCSV